VPIERELKYSLSSRDYIRLKRFLWTKGLKRKIQTNYYFDTPSLILQQKKAGLRIRIENRHDAVVTLKLPVRSTKPKDGFKARYEHNYPIRLDLARRIIAGKIPITILPFTALIPYHHLNLQCLGTLRTLRHVKSLDRKHVLEIDKCSCFGITFFELEVETSSPQKIGRLLREKFGRLGIALRPSNRSKLARFLAEWKTKSSTRPSPRARANKKSIGPRRPVNSPDP